ncbi:MAG: hypothetical protein JWO62_2739 [Acidimicrobiaceae bacterium]|jgi:hypothetical protein|nr:hypothetical protein [Acidimicrobiaceae bacterium]
MLRVGPTRTSPPASVLHAHVATRATVVACSQPGKTAPAISYLTSPEASNAYYLAETNGALRNYGAAFYGSAVHSRLVGTVIGAAPTIDGDGYWLATSKGSVHGYGDAHFYGSAVHVKHAQPIVAFAATPDSGGYLLVGSGGAIYNYGDAAFCGSAVHDHLTSPVVGIAVTPDGKGYWLATANGLVYSFGDAPAIGAAKKTLAAPVVAIAPSVGGKGYWLVTSAGNIYNYGDAGFFGSPVHKHMTKPVVGITASADGQGYWIVTAHGQVFNFGDAQFEGSLVHAPLKAKTQVISLFRRPVPPLPPVVSTPTPILASSPTTVHGLFGYDISNYQCSTGSPTTASPSLPSSSGISILEVAGWLDSSSNSCLASEAAWATGAAGTSGNHYQLYLFLNSPGTTAAAQSQAASGPAGTCSTLSGTAVPSCVAYNYGFNGAKQALASATSAGVSTNIWWVDVENTNLSKNDYSNFPSAYWSGSTALNDQTIQGAIDALHQGNVTVGIYSTSPQFATIAGPFVPSGPQVPLWVAGVPWTNPPYTESGLFSSSTLASWCAGTAVYGGTNNGVDFAGGVPWLLQETPGSEPSPYSLDPDYVC